MWLNHIKVTKYTSKSVLSTRNTKYNSYQRRQWHPTPVLLPGKSHGWRSLVGCSPWDRSESERTERLHFHFSLSCIGEGNDNPLQCSCLENPRDGGAWWAAVYGVTQSRTRLKWLSISISSSSIHVCTLVKANFMCQLDWTNSYLDSWKKIISGCVCESVPGD